MQRLFPSSCCYDPGRGKVSSHKQSAVYHTPVLLLTWGYGYLSLASCGFRFQSHHHCCFLTSPEHFHLAVLILGYPTKILTQFFKNVLSSLPINALMKFPGVGKNTNVRGEGRRFTNVGEFHG